MTRTAIVTGGSRGLGRAFAAELARRDWTVVIDGRAGPELRGAAARIGVSALSGDVCDPDHLLALVGEAVRLGGGVDLLVNNASFLGPSPMPRLCDYPVAALRHVLETNVVAPLALVQLALPALRERAGSVVNVTSDAAVEGYAGWGGYGSSKAALEQWSRVLAAEEPEVRVWWVDPGDMRTRMHQDAFFGEDISDRPLPEDMAAPALYDLVERRPPSGRVVLGAK